MPKKPNTPLEALSSRIASRSARVGVIGLGYVGLPLVIEFSRARFPTIGFDIDPDKVRRLMRGESYIHHIPATRIRELIKGRKAEFTATTDFARLAEADAILICVPTPLTRTKDPDLTYVINSVNAVARYLRPGQLVVLESTTYPGTTDEEVLPRLEQQGRFKIDRDFLLAFSPEREDPGNKDYTTRTIPKVVGGVTRKSGEVAAALYGQVMDKVVPVASAKVAEACKILENTYRSVNIALVNELKVILDRMGIDVWDVIEAAKTKPFGFHPFYPGPGLGGHCIPIDPYYLSWKAREYEVQAHFIELAGDINTRMPEYVVAKTARALDERGKTMRGARVLVLGVAYKRDIDDMRESPAIRVIQLLEDQGARVAYHDPFIPVFPRVRKAAFDLKSVPLTRQTLAAQDAVIIVTDHTDVDYAFVCRNSKLVVDTRNACARVRAPKGKVVKA